MNNFFRKQFFLTVSFIIILTLGLRAQTYHLTVSNGYGSGNYRAGDTVHIWSEAYDNTKTFSHWSGDTQYLKSPNEWHTKLIMPDQNISLSSVIANMPTYTINYEQIKGVNNLKNVYSFFPLNLKGVIYLFHGTSGNASNSINAVENRSFINAAIADSYGIIVTEAEEITMNTDLNGDGKFRWHTFPIDTVNGIDYLNIKAITDTFIHRGNFNNSTPKFSVGMSNGGSFSAAISYAYNFTAGISYCASSAKGIFEKRTNPFAFRMAKFDDNPEVGSQGNYDAWQYDSIMETRNVCHDYQIHDRQPIYTERFARISGISVSTSQKLFQDLVDNNQLDVHNYALHADTIINNILAHPSHYPNIIALSSSLKKDVLSQISASNAEHKFYSDYNFESLDFFNKLCSTSAAIESINSGKKCLKIFPNPVRNFVNIDLPNKSFSVSILNATSQRILFLKNATSTTKIDLSNLEKGLYIITAIDGENIFTSKIIKQ